VAHLSGQFIAETANRGGQRTNLKRRSIMAKVMLGGVSFADFWRTMFAVIEKAAYSEQFFATLKKLRLERHEDSGSEREGFKISAQIVGYSLAELRMALYHNSVRLMPAAESKLAELPPEEMREALGLWVNAKSEHHTGYFAEVMRDIPAVRALPRVAGVYLAMRLAATWKQGLLPREFHIVFIPSRGIDDSKSNWCFVVNIWPERGFFELDVLNTCSYFDCKEIHFFGRESV
jgi:hypothetical protein